jgi:DNA-binding transcriptional ArsR family regulator
MSHGEPPTTETITIDAGIAAEVADALTVLASPGRVMILGHLREGPAAVGELAVAAGLSPSATSHQLRMLRHMGWVVRERRGRQIFYSLHDPHVADLLAQAVFHVDHVRAARHDHAHSWGVVALEPGIEQPVPPAA